MGIIKVKRKKREATFGPKMCPGVVSCETNIVLACVCGHCLPAAKPTQGTTDVSTRHCLGLHTAFDLSEEGGIFSTENYYI